MNKKTHRCKAFTLVELMAVLLILALIGGFAGKNIANAIKKAKITTTKTRLKELHQAVMMFHMDTGRYPDEDMGLQELVEEPTDVEGWAEGGYLESTEVPLDAWKHEFDYVLNPESGKPFVIISYGADGKEGGEEDTEDWDLWSTDVD